MKIIKTIGLALIDQVKLIDLYSTENIIGYYAVN